jgi:hypothetical protein
MLSLYESLISKEGMIKFLFSSKLTKEALDAVLGVIYNLSPDGTYDVTEALLKIRDIDPPNYKSATLNSFLKRAKTRFGATLDLPVQLQNVSAITVSYFRVLSMISS